MSIERNDEPLAGENLECVNKLMEIEIIRNATDNVGKFYSSLKARNFLFTLWLDTAELGIRLVYRGVEPIRNTFQGPIKLADFYVCKVLAGVQENVPVIFGVPTSVITNTCTTVLNSTIGQIVLRGADNVLYVVERVVTLVPEISVINDPKYLFAHPFNSDNEALDPILVKFQVIDVDTEDDKQKNAITVLEQVKTAYSVATTPLQLTGKFIHGSRDVIKQFKKEETHIAKELQPRGFLERILNIPVKGLHYIGMLSEKRSICNRQRDSELRLSPDECNKELEEVQTQWTALENSDTLSDSTKSTDLTISSQEDIENEVPASDANEPDSLEVRKNPKMVHNSQTRVTKPVKPISRKLGQTTPYLTPTKSNTIRTPIQRQPYKTSTRMQNTTSKDSRKVKSESEVRRNSAQIKPSRVVTG